MQPKTFAVIATVLVLLTVINLIRRQKMSFKYAFSWLMVSACVVFFVVYDELLRQIAKWAGFTLASNFIFFLLLIFVIFFSLLLTIHINEQNNRSESMAQTIAKLDLRIKQLEKEKKNP